MTQPYAKAERSHAVPVQRLPPPNENDLLAAHTAAYQALLQEIELASKFNSERLVRVLGACMADRHNICLIMELVPGMNTPPPSPRSSGSRTHARTHARPGLICIPCAHQWGRHLASMIIQ